MEGMGRLSPNVLRCGFCARILASFSGNGIGVCSHCDQECDTPCRVCSALFDRERT